MLMLFSNELDENIDKKEIAKPNIAPKSTAPKPTYIAKAPKK